jgi:hypothetical protein
MLKSGHQVAHAYETRRRQPGAGLGKPVPVAQLDFTSAASPADMVA